MNKNTVGIGLEALNTRLLRLTEMIQEASKFPNRSSRTRPSYSLEELEEQLHCFLKDEVLPFKGNTDSQFWFFSYLSKIIPNLPEARTDTLELICKWCADKPEVYSTYSVQATFWAISVQPNANYQSLEILLNLVENKIRESKKANPNTMTGVYAQRIRWAIWNHPTYLTTKAREAELGDLPVDWLASLLLPKDLTAPQNIFKMREWRV